MSEVIFISSRVNGKEKLQVLAPREQVEGLEPGKIEEGLKLDHIGAVVNASLERGEAAAKKCLDALNRAYPEGK